MEDTKRRIETATKDAVRQRNYRRVRDRALTRLGALHKEEYLALLEEERIKDEVEGKAWLDITGRTNAGMGKTSLNISSGDAKRRSNKVETGNLGGEG